MIFTRGAGAAGIGGGDEDAFHGGEGGNVTIRGDVYMTIYGDGYTEAIGAGGADSKSGTLRLDDHLCVLVGGELVPAKNRTKKAHHYNDGKNLDIKPCVHTDVTITAMADAHVITCNSCYAHTITEEHQYEGASLTCTVCGYNSSMYAVALSPGDGAGPVETFYVEPGGSFSLPENRYAAPEGKHFAGWLFSTDKKVYQEGETVTISEQSILTAQWTDRYTVTFDPGLNEGEYEGEMADEDYAEGETFYVPDNHFMADTELGFARWAYTGADGTSGYLYPDDEVVMATDLSLTAQYDIYVPVTLTPEYDGTDEETITYDMARGSMLSLPEYMFTLPEGIQFEDWSVKIGNAEAVTKAPGDKIEVTAEITATARFTMAFAPASFTLPTGTKAVEASAFEGAAMDSVSIPNGCTAIGDHAFKDCASLTRIRIPANCALGADVFDGCERVYVFGAVGSPAETYCQSHGNCVFVEAE